MDSSTWEWNLEVYIYNKNVDENLKNKKERKNDDEKSVISFFPNNRREENISSS